MRGGNSLISPDLGVRDALIIVRGMLSVPETSVRGIIDGVKYIRMHLRQHGHELNFQTLFGLVCTESNTVVKASISENIISERIMWISQQTRSLLDSAIQFSLLDQARLIELRCQSSFNLAEIFRQKRRLRSSLTLLKECELMLLSVDLDQSEILECPSLNLIRTCIAESMLVIGDPSVALEKCELVLDSIKTSQEASKTEKLQTAYALLIFVKASSRLGRLRDAADRTTQILTELRRDISPDADTYLMSLIDRIDSEISGSLIRGRSHALAPPPESPLSRGRSEPPGTSRHRKPAVESHTVYIAPESQGVSSYCQTGDEEPLNAPSDTSQRSQSVPPVGKKYMQSPSATIGHDDDNKEIPSELSTSAGVEDLQWVECTSRNLGKQYWYNTTTGESTWNRA